jgi:hypothetical protein
MNIHNSTFGAMIGAAALALMVSACGDERHAKASSPDAARSQAAADVAKLKDTNVAGTTRYADANNDGQVTRDEATADPALYATFDAYDSDRNDSLDRAEFARLEQHATGDDTAQLRPRREFPRPLD